MKNAIIGAVFLITLGFALLAASCSGPEESVACATYEEPSPSFDQGPWLQRRQREMDYALALGPSQIIVQAGDAVVDQMAISFDFTNLSDDEYIFGLDWDLAFNAEGHWQPVPFAKPYRAINDIGFIIQSGQTLTTDVCFIWDFDELAPGRYMFIRRHTIVREWDPQRPPVWEYLLVEFTIE